MANANSRRAQFAAQALHRVLRQSLSDLLSIVTQEGTMSDPRRILLVRTVGTLCADLAVGIAVASAVSWVIQAASLGLFLSFLLWMLGAIVALALSQYLVHPVAKVLLSDHKLDLAFNVIDDFAGQAGRLGLRLLSRIKAAT